jgi:tellurite resistance protein TerC
MSTLGSPGLWVGFVIFVLVMLALDLGVFHRQARVVTTREALGWAGVWVALASLFGAGLWWAFGADPALEFFSGWLIEKSLSLDNLFVFVVIFSALGVPAASQHRVLFWGVVTALVLRAVMIFLGVELLTHFHWLAPVLGVFLVLTGLKLVVDRNRAEDPQQGWLLRLARRLVPSTPHLDGDRFFTVSNGRRLATPLFLALVLVEATDVLFAVDSIPAVFAVTLDPFLVFTSNLFAILGLRSLFFLLSGAVDRFRHLKLGLAAVLVFVGVKMAVASWVVIAPLVSVAVIAGLLGLAVLASWRLAPSAPPPERDLHRFRAT